MFAEVEIYVYLCAIVIEKHIVLEDIDPVMFYGIGNQYLQMLRALFPKLRIVARDNVMRILGDEEQMAAFEEAAEKILIAPCCKSRANVRAACSVFGSQPTMMRDG